LLQQRDSSLAGKALEEAIWKLHKYRQEKDSNPEKTAVAPDKSDTQTLAGQISHWSSSETLVSPTLDAVQTNMLPDHPNQDIEKQLREGLRSIAKEYRQQGISRSTAPDLRNMTERQFLLEVLSKPDWSDRLQERGIEVNEQTLQVISWQLKKIHPSNLLDYNTAVGNFNEKCEGKDLARLRVEPAGLRGGIYWTDRGGQPHARFMSLKNPLGDEHEFYIGETNTEIATFTEDWVTEHLRVSTHNKKNYCLSKSDVQRFVKEGDECNHWTCTELTYHPMEKGVYCTDKGTRIYTLRNAPYEDYAEEDDKNFQYFLSMPHNQIEGPTAAYCCHGLTFLNTDGWVLSKGGVIQTILDENGYLPIADRRNAQIGDIAVYFSQEKITHTAPVIAITEQGDIIVDSKPGRLGRKGLCRNNLPNWLDRIVPFGMTGVPSKMHVFHLFLCWLFTQVIGTCIKNCSHIQP
jgi:hypothetical protein